MKYTLSVLVENQPGVLSKVTSLFARRGYNIDSLTVAPGEDSGVSRMTIVGEGDNYTLEQMEKQLNKVIPVIKVRELGAGKDVVSSQLMFVKVGCDKQSLESLKALVELMGAQAVKVTATSLTVKFAGDHETCETLCELLKPYGIRQVVRSGIIAMEAD